MLTWGTAALFVLVALWIGISGRGTTAAFGGMFVDDGFSRFAKVVILLSAAAILILSSQLPGALGSAAPSDLGVLGRAWFARVNGVTVRRAWPHSAS